jgi:hypothetical protein
VPGSRQVSEVGRNVADLIPPVRPCKIDCCRIEFGGRTGRTPATEVTGVLIPSTEEEL